jgi:hypothetical protein
MKWMGAVRPTERRMDGSIEEVRVKGVPVNAMIPRVAPRDIITTNCGRNMPETLPKRIAIKKKVRASTEMDM